MSRLEKSVEARFIKLLREWSLENGVYTLCWKLNPLGIRGLPDRLVLWPNKGVFFVEFKREGQVARKLQEYTHAQLRKLGFDVEVHDDELSAMAATEARIRASLGTN